MRPVDVRIVAATNCDLARAVESGEFRADLFYRIRVGRVQIPPLRQRREDIPLMVRAFLAEHAAASGKLIEGLSPAAITLLLEHDWPGNVRELRNTLEYAVLRCTGTIIGAHELPPELLSDSAGIVGHPYEEDERERIVTAIERSGGNRTRAAQRLGMSRATFYRRLAQLDIRDL